MKPENFTERKKLFIKFGIVYLGTIILLAGGYLLSSGHEEPPATGPLPAPEQVKAATISAIDKANDLLGRHADQLRQLDMKYISQLIDSFSRPALEDINEAIHAEEVSFGKAIDSLELQGAPFISLATAFRSVLNDHLSVSNIRLTLPAGAKRPNDRQQELLRALKELQEKDSRISLLERRLREFAPDNKNVVAGEDPGTLSALQADNDVLRQRLNDQQKVETALREQLGGLQHTRDAANNALTIRNSTLERRMTGLADELRFARVDCNLSRVDGRQLIYTAKQRKDLMTDALAVLNDLVTSPNAEVQQKARERLAQLKNLAAAAHD